MGRATTAGSPRPLSNSCHEWPGPIENKRTFLEVSADIVEHVDPIFYGDPKTAALKVIGGP